MDTYYQQWHRLADDLHYRVQDSFSETHAAVCQELKDQMRELIVDLSQQKPPRTIEVRLERVIQLIEPARHGQNAYMSVQDAITFHDAFERMRREVRQHPHHS